ncbi:MAG TPA: SDR family NAD(P)-dependent oxidoreductase [Acidimicrobiales bacterium]|nr:SDR family NAD(P)-dependent oxidoreductase [Acidimicrobiales bacterium]
MKVLVTGSADGLGLLSARWLAERGHEVVLHARDDRRAAEATAAVPGATSAVVADLADLAAVQRLARRLDPVDTVIHNAGVGYTRPRREEGADGHELHLTVNVLGPYLLTVTMPRPSRLVWLSSGMHRGGDPSLDDLEWVRRRWSGSAAYSDSKLFDVGLALAFARLWPEVTSHAVEPGWVATKMGGPGAPDDLQAGAETQAWLATTDDDVGTGGYWYHRRRRQPLEVTTDPAWQDRLLAACAAATGVDVT